MAARDTNLYTFARADRRPLPGAMPGAHIGVILPNGVERQYSLIHYGAEFSEYTVGVKRDIEQPRRFGLHARPTAGGHEGDARSSAQQFPAQGRRGPRRSARGRHRHHADLLHGQAPHRIEAALAIALLVPLARRCRFSRRVVAIRRLPLPFRRGGGRQIPRRGRHRREDAQDRASLLLRTRADAGGVRGGDRRLAGRADPRRILHAEIRGRRGRRICRRARPLQARADHPAGQIDPSSGARSRDPGAAFLRRRRMRRLRDARHLRHSRPPRFDPDRQRAQRERDHDDLLLGLEDRPSWCSTSDGPDATKPRWGWTPCAGCAGWMRARYRMRSID